MRSVENNVVSMKCPGEEDFIPFPEGRRDGKEPGDRTNDGQAKDEMEIRFLRYLLDAWILHQHQPPREILASPRPCFSFPGKSSGSIALRVIYVNLLNLRELVGRLCYPVASPIVDYAFCKGYYARVTDRMHGRVTRLFVTPLVRSLRKLLGNVPLLAYLDSFRYPLAGEFSMLAELCETCEHKHQPLSAEDMRTGLVKMSIDIAKAVFRNLASEGIVLSQSALGTLIINYQRTAKDTIKQYSDDAAINGLAFDYHQESVMVESFTRAVQMAGQAFLEDPLYSPLIPSWNRVISAIPNFLDLLNAVVEKDNAD